MTFIHWNDQERKVAAELGPDEIQERVRKLEGDPSDYAIPGAALTVVRAEMTRRGRG